MTRPGLSVESAPALRSVLYKFTETQASLAVCVGSPAAENVAKTVTSALETAALLLDFVATFNIPPDRFFDCVRQFESSSYPEILSFVKDHQKS